MKRINLNTTIGKVLDTFPESKEFFESKNMYCWVCKGKKHETIQYAATYYGFDANQFLEELKNFIKNKQTKLKKVK